MGKNPTFIEQAKILIRTTGYSCPITLNEIGCEKCVIYYVLGVDEMCSRHRRYELSKKYLRIQKLKRILSL